MTHLSKAYTALFALGLDALSGVALCADQLGDRLPVEVVRLVLIVTVPAHVQLVTAGRHELGPSLVVGTSHPLLGRGLRLLAAGDSVRGTEWLGRHRCRGGGGR